MAEQMRHSYDNNKDRKSHAAKQAKPVRGRPFDAPPDAEWTVFNGGANEAARELGLNPGSISRCCHQALAGKVWRVGAYTFEFGEPLEPLHLPGEVWKDVKGSKNAAVSSYGRVRNCFGVVTTPTPSQDGYVRVKIDGKDRFVHWLVAEAFELPRKEGEDTVEHGDGNPSNNCVWNLRFASQKEQVEASFANNLNRASNAPLLSKPVIGRPIGETEWTSYDSANDAARKLGLDSGHIRACARGKQKQTGGYEFEWAESGEPDLLPGEEWRDIILSELVA